MAREFTEAEACAVAIVYDAKDREPLPVSSLGREARIRRESDREDATNPVCSPEAAEDARQALAPYRDVEGKPVTLLELPVVVNPNMQTGAPPVFGPPLRVERLTAEEIAQMQAWLDSRSPEHVADWWHVAFEPERIVATLQLQMAAQERRQVREDAVYAKGYRRGYWDGSNANETAFQILVDDAVEQWVKLGRKTHLDEEEP